jgi:hypothetical protein
MVKAIKRFYPLIVGWFRPVTRAEPMTSPSPELSPPQIAPGLTVFHGRDKWLRPPRKSERAERKPRREIVAKRQRATTEPVTKITRQRDNPWSFARDSEDSGVFYFRGALLDRLDHYFRMLARMRHGDRDAYDLYSKVGGVMLPHSAMGATHELPAFWRDPKKRPAFGCVCFMRDTPEEEEKEDNTLQLAYFKKLEHPPAEVQPTAGDVYELCVYYDDLGTGAVGRRRKHPKWMRRGGFAMQYYVSIEPDGSLRALKTLQTSYETITSRGGHFGYSNSACSNKSRGGGGGQSTRRQMFTHHVPYRHWDYPKFAHECWRERKDKLQFPTFEQWAATNLNSLANFAQSAELGVLVTVKNQISDAAVFALEWKRTAYFFKDRDVTINEKGSVARIFHIVRPHMRKLKDGRELAVKLHFRGLRTFQWGKYSVQVTVPGLHHMPLVEFTPGMTDALALPPEERHDMITMKTVGEKLAEHIGGVPLAAINWEDHTQSRERSAPTETGHA